MARDEDGYPMEADDAPFTGGSTEQKDTWLGEKLGETDVRSPEFREAMKVAQAQLDAPDAALAAWARPFLAGARSKDDLFRALTTARREQIGRGLFHSERAALWSVTNTLWAEPRTVAA
jgi:hypothetical protein